MLTALAIWAVASGGMEQSLIDSIALLKRVGYPDLAGALYCQAKVSLGDSKFLAKGWVLKGSKEPRFVAAGGSPYRLVEVVKPLDLRAEAVAAFNEGWLSFKMPGSTELSGSDFSLALIYMSGETELARSCLDRRENRTGRAICNAILATVLNDRLDDVAAAFTTGDDSEAASKAKWLMDNRAWIVREATAITESQAAFQKRSLISASTELSFLGAADGIYADAKRRLRQPHKARELSELDRLPAKERIRALIDELDQVRVTQTIYPGILNPVDDPRVQSLINVGQDAIEPLLDCIEKDTRLTRSTAGRYDNFGVKLLPVHGAARAAFEQILQAFMLPEGATPADLRDFWRRTQAMSAEERYFAILLDDSAQWEWTNAASYVTSPTSRVYISRDSYPQSSPPDPTLPLKGESLRGKSNPSVSEILGRRALEFAQTRSPFELLAMLEKWDPEAFVEYGRSCLKILASKEIPLRESFISAPQFAKFMRAMNDHGDTESLAIYVAWLRNVKPFEFEFGFATFFYPLVRFQDRPEVRGLSAQIFGGPNPIIRLAAQHERKYGGSGAVDLIVSPLLQIKEVRDEAIAILRNRKSLGVTYVEKGIIHNVIDGSFSGGNEDLASKDLVAWEGKSTLYRVCDSLAWSLTRRTQKQIHTFLPLVDRDRMIEELIESLEANTFPIPTVWPGDYGHDLEPRS